MSAVKQIEGEGPGLQIKPLNFNEEEQFIDPSIRELSIRNSTCFKYLYDQEASECQACMLNKACYSEFQQLMINLEGEFTSFELLPPEKKRRKPLDLKGWTKIKLSLSTICSICNEGIPEGDHCYQKTGEGTAHEECWMEKHGDD